MRDTAEHEGKGGFQVWTICATPTATAPACNDPSYCHQAWDVHDKHIIPIGNSARIWYNDGTRICVLYLRALHKLSTGLHILRMDSRTVHRLTPMCQQQYTRKACQRMRTPLILLACSRRGILHWKLPAKLPCNTYSLSLKIGI